MTLLRLSSLMALTAVVAACSSSGGDGGSAPVDLVVGVQSEDLYGFATSFHLVATLDGKVVSDQTAGPTELPKEIAITGNVGARLEVVVDAFPGQASTDPFLTKRAATTLAKSDVKRLVRVALDDRCITLSPLGGGSFTPGPTCAAPLTCTQGTCVAEDAQLETYEADWAANPPDICRPANHGAPEVVEGTGQTDYLPLTDGQTLQLEKGPQGGHHIWIATRMKNLRQSGSRTVLTATVPSDPTITVPEAAYVFTFDPDEGNYCKLYGLRFQLDADAADLTQNYKKYLGKSLQVTTTVTDSTNASASSTKTINISPDLLCPDGTSGTCD